MKIFLTVGTHHTGFNRLLKIADTWAGKHKNTEIFALTGNSTYEPKNFNGKKFCNYSEYISKLKNSDIVVSHAGSGSIIDTLGLKKPLVLIPRLKKFGEHSNNHQFETAESLDRAGLAILADGRNFADKMKFAEKFKPTVRFEKKKTIKILEKFLKGLE